MALNLKQKHQCEFMIKSQFPSCPTERPRATTSPEAMSIPSAQTVVSRHRILYKRQRELLRETANSRPRVKHKMNLKHLTISESRERKTTGHIKGQVNSQRPHWQKGPKFSIDKNSNCERLKHITPV